MKLTTYSSSWCEKIIFTSASLIFIILGVDYKFTVLPFNGILLLLYLMILVTSATWLTFIYLQNLLRNNKPFEYDLEKNLFLKYMQQLYNYITRQQDASTNLQANDMDSNHLIEKRTKNIDERIDEFVKDVETRFILRWYVNISNDPSFPSESKALLDDVIRRFLQIVVEVDSKKLIHGFIVIFLKHVKEFRKTIKRSHRNDGTIEELYRYSHVASKSQKAFEHYVYSLTACILKQFINWELWTSLPCRSLVSILSRKFTTYILNYISAPGFLNYHLLNLCASEFTKSSLKLDHYYFVSVSDVDHSGGLVQLKEHPIAASKVSLKEKTVERIKLEDNHTPKISPKRTMKKTTPDLIENTAYDVVDSIKTTESALAVTQTPVDRNSSSDLQELSKPEEETTKPETCPKSSEPVRIYESKSSSNKTWRNSSDLECISLGQDLLAFQEFSDPNTQIQELIEKKLWKDTADVADEEKSACMWDIPESWCGEEASDITETIPTSPSTDFKSYLKSSTNPAALISNTMKPIENVTASTLHNMKELQQSTVNTVSNVVKPVSQAATNAMHKVGDLQDEAAGVVEGILDFGMAGLRKGLRLTGLQENFTELTQKAKHEFQRTEPVKPVHVSKPKTTEPMKIIDKELSGKHSEHRSVAKLVKTSCIASEDDKLEPPSQSSSESDESVWINPLTKESSPSFDGDILLERTPDSLPKPNTIINLDHQQPSTQDIPQITEDILSAVDSPDPEYEESQDLASTIAKLRNLLQQKSSESGFTTPALSPMPQDELAKTPAEPPPTDLSKVDGAMPSLYKFCARTATGVFQNTLNTIKTALPGNVSESTQNLVQCTNDDWTFVEADICNDDFYSRMKKLLSERRAFCTVDTAYEAIDSLDVVDQPEITWTAPVLQFDDELDEFDLQVPITKALVDVICELIGDADTCLLQESVVKVILLFIGHCSEEIITNKAESLLHNVNKFVGKLPENTNQEAVAVKLDEMVKGCLEAFPGTAKGLIGESTLEAGIRLLINSLQSQRINQDIFMQMFELFATQLISACSQVSPAYSA